MGHCSAIEISNGNQPHRCKSHGRLHEKPFSIVGYFITAAHLFAKTFTGQGKPPQSQWTTTNLPSTVVVARKRIHLRCLEFVGKNAKAINAKRYRMDLFAHYAKKLVGLRRFYRRRHLEYDSCQKPRLPLGKICTTYRKRQLLAKSYRNHSSAAMQTSNRHPLLRNRNIASHGKQRVLPSQSHWLVAPSIR